MLFSVHLFHHHIHYTYVHGPTDEFQKYNSKRGPRKIWIQVPHLLSKDHTFNNEAHTFDMAAGLWELNKCPN